MGNIQPVHINYQVILINPDQDIGVIKQEMEADSYLRRFDTRVSLELIREDGTCKLNFTFPNRSNSPFGSAVLMYVESETLQWFNHA